MVSSARRQTLFILDETTSALDNETHPNRLAQRSVPAETEIHCRPERFELIAEIVQSVQTTINVEKSRWSGINNPPPIHSRQ